MKREFFGRFMVKRFPEVMDRWKTLAWIWHDLLNDRGRKTSLALFFIILIGTVFSTAQPYGLGMVISAITKQDADMLTLSIGILLAFVVVEQTITWIRQYVRERIFNVNFWHIPMRLTRQYFERTLGMLVTEDAEIDGGGVESTKDKINTIQQQILFSILPSYSICFFNIMACVWVNWILGLMALVSITIDLIWSYRQNNYIHRAMDPIDQQVRRWDRRTRARWADAPTVKYNSVERRIESDLTHEIQPTLKDDFEVWGRWVPRSIFKQKILGGLLRVATYALAGYMVIEGKVNIEGLTLLVFSLEGVHVALYEISNSQRVIQENLIRVRAYRDALTVTPDFNYSAGVEFMPCGNGVAIELERVSLTHKLRGKDKPILKDVSMRIEKGERVAIIGPSGAGKSQLTNLLLRAFDPTEGRVLVDGVDLRTIALESFGRYVGHVPQSPEVLEGTVRENVCFGLSPVAMRGVTDEMVWEAIRKAGLDFSGRLNDGLDTSVGYKGMRLSGGERQRLTIALAHIKEPKLVIADEPTSALDSLSEAHVLDELYGSLKEGATAIMIAHRFSSLEGCTKIIFVRPLCFCKEGEEQVSTYTSMKELYDTDTLFRQMADMQGYRP